MMKINMIILFLLTLWSCDDAKIEQETNKFKVLNLTDYNIENVHAFSVSLGDLLPKKESGTYELDFSIQGPIISFKSEEVIFVRYLTRDSTKSLNSIVIDSLNFQNMNVHLHIE